MIQFIVIDSLIMLLSFIIFHATILIIDDKKEFIVQAISGSIFILTLLALPIVGLLNSFGLVF